MPYLFYDWLVLALASNPLKSRRSESELEEELRDVQEGEQEGNVCIGSLLLNFTYCQINVFYCDIKFCFKY